MFKDEFTEGELVDLTEKVHGSQVNVLRSEDGVVTLTSKYLGHEGFVIDEDYTNKYWQAVKNSGLLDRLRSDTYKGKSVQVIAEAIPFHKGFSYGCTEPTVRVFKLVINGEVIPLDKIGYSYDYFPDLWVPIIARMPFNSAVFNVYADGREQVSGKEIHIREGVVITPVTPRLDSEGHGLAIKYLNSKFKGAPTDFA
jgi:RNA ligase (TIGR02306 family)